MSFSVRILIGTTTRACLLQSASSFYVLSLCCAKHCIQSLERLRHIAANIATMLGVRISGYPGVFPAVCTPTEFLFFSGKTSQDCICNTKTLAPVVSLVCVPYYQVKYLRATLQLTVTILCLEQHFLQFTWLPLATGCLVGANHLGRA